MATQIVIINGYPGSGKDTFVEACKKVYEHTYNIHTSDPAKAALHALGWVGDKTPEARSLLADMVAFSYKYDGPIQLVSDWVTNIEGITSNGVLFVHCREWENVLKFQKHFPSCLTIFIDRAEAEAPYRAEEKSLLHNNSDSNAGYNKNQYAYVFHNNGTLKDLEYSASIFMIVATERGKTL